eukprot:scaffold1017_cov363-Pavlova_lutheri.AAC.4
MARPCDPRPHEGPPKDRPGTVIRWSEFEGPWRVVDRVDSELARCRWHKHLVDPRTTMVRSAQLVLLLLFALSPWIGRVLGEEEKQCESQGGERMRGCIAPSEQDGVQGSSSTDRTRNDRCRCVRIDTRRRCSGVPWPIHECFAPIRPEHRSFSRSAARLFEAGCGVPGARKDRPCHPGLQQRSARRPAVHPRILQSGETTEENV